MNFINLCFVFSISIYSPHFHPDFPHSHLYSPHSTLIPIISTLILIIPTLIPRLPTLIPRILTLIPRIPTLIPRIPIILFILFPDSPFRLLQIALRFFGPFFCLKVKVLKMLKILIDCHIKTCRSPKWTAILKISSTVF